MTLCVRYPTKKALRESVGKRLNFFETTMFAPEYRDDGKLTVAHRPHLTGGGREFFAQVVMQEGRIKSVT